MKNLYKFFGGIALIVSFGCASSHVITPKNASESQIEIDYVLGHSRYKYVAIGGEHDAEISSYRDEKKLESKLISLKKYQDFAARLEDAIQSSPSGVIDEACRTPYEIKIKIGPKASKMSGCRSADTEGNIGKLLKEGVFLMYSERSLEN